MSADDRLTGRQIAAGRVLAGIGQEKLARRANIPMGLLRRLEATEGPITAQDESVLKVQRALEELGIRFIPENGGGVGVQLKFTASEVRRLATLENEGGIVADDDI